MFPRVGENRVATEPGPVFRRQMSDGQQWSGWSWAGAVARKAKPSLARGATACLATPASSGANGADNCLMWLIGMENLDGFVRVRSEQGPEDKWSVELQSKVWSVHCLLRRVFAEQPPVNTPQWRQGLSRKWKTVF